MIQRLDIYFLQTQHTPAAADYHYMWTKRRRLKLKYKKCTNAPTQIVRVESELKNWIVGCCTYFDISLIFVYIIYFIYLCKQIHFNANASKINMLCFNTHTHIWLIVVSIVSHTRTIITIIIIERARESLLFFFYVFRYEIRVHTQHNYSN